MRNFQFIALTPPGLTDPTIAVAASRSGAWGVLDLEYCADEQSAIHAVGEIARSAATTCGVKLSGSNQEFLSRVVENLPQKIGIVLLTSVASEDIGSLIGSLRSRGITVLWESTSVESAEQGARLGVHGIVAKGNEAGGRVGEETSFVLLQRILASTRLPVWVQGGIGLHTAAACYAAGASGAVLDNQLWLTRESSLPETVKSAITHMDGSETVFLGGELDEAYRVYSRPGRLGLEELRKSIKSLRESPEPREEKLQSWRRAVEERIGWSADGHVWLLGQDAAFASSLAQQFHTVQGVLVGMIEAVAVHLSAAQKMKPLDEGSPLAVSHGTRYPIIQGPMTRVSDTAKFADAVAASGGLPFLALALMRAPEVDRLLRETSQVLGDKPWGVGILGFVPAELRQEQLDVVRKYRPPFALIAGGRPDQSKALEQDGIVTYLHVPSPGLLRIFLENGARHFVFEGRECGGHVGPRSSFVLWETMIRELESLPHNELAKCHVLFAGGIHDGLSGSMVATMVAPLAERGLKVGALLGTAYLFTKEAVDAGAIVRGFQREALRCNRTVLLETGPGHAIRCVPTPYVDFFEQQKRHFEASATAPEEARIALEMLNVGRLRVASKGITRPPRDQENASVDGFVKLSQSEQRHDGMYMIGQVAALHHEVCTIQQLHHDVAVNSTERLLRLPEMQWSGKAASRSSSCDVAVVGMACVLPKAGDVRTYWENILGKVDAITEVPAERWDWRKYYDPDPAAPDKSYSKWGGFLDDVPFDPLNYGIPPNALSSIEPLQLLTLEVARRALEDAGYATRPFARERASVILGAGGGGGDLAQRYGMRVALTAASPDSTADMPQQLPKWTEDSFPGILSNVAAGRVANRFDFGGVNYTIDAACASSLAAIYHAVKELEAGTSDLVIAGGADTVQSPFAYVCFSKTHAFSRHGHCRTFDESADGIVISEGVAAVVLKRLSDAQLDGDRIYAVIKGIAGSSDGRDKSLTAPRVEGQLLALKRAYDKAGISPATVKLIEAHGTGTVAGDQAEIEALKRLFEASGTSAESCAVGSVKSLIGHTKATAGVAGLIKATLALYHRVLPPTGGVEKPNTKARFPESPFYVNSELQPWLNDDSEHPRRAGVSAFGFGGTNFHAVLEEYSDGNRGGERAPWERWPGELLLWAGKSREEILAALANLERALAAGAKPELCDLARSLWQHTKKDAATKNGAVRLRLAIIATSLEDLGQKLGVARENLLNPACRHIQDVRGIYLTEQPLTSDGHLAFLFPGQGSQYVGMLRDLAIQFPEVRERFEMADRVLQTELPAPLSSYVFPPASFSPAEVQGRQQKLIRTNVAQPALGAAGIGLFRLLEALGVRARSVAGHSYGEYVALCAAGVFSEQMLLKMSEARGRLILEATTTTEPGTMAAIDAGASAVGDLLRGLEEVWIANLNSPRQTTISGTKRGVENAVSKIKAAGIQAHPLPVACAFHSPVISRARDLLAKWLAQVEFATPQMGVFSNSSAALYAQPPSEYASLLAEHLVRPVDFVGEINAMYSAGARIFLEVGPRNVLTGLTTQILGDRPHVAIATDISGRPGLLQLQHALGELFAHGVPVQLDRLFQGRKLRDHNLDTLLEQSRERTLPATTWMVNGGRACSLAEAGKAKSTQLSTPLEPSVRQPRTTSLPVLGSRTSSPSGEGQESSRRVSAHSDAPGVRTPISSPVLSPVSVVSGPGSAAVMLQFNHLMTQFLATQKEVMLSCLQLGNGHDSAHLPTLSAANLAGHNGSNGSRELTIKNSDGMERSAVVSEPEASITEPSARSSDSTGETTPDKLPVKTDSESLTAELLKLVTERTGYPEDMLGLDVDIEAELGIDSIKRIEILSGFVQYCLPSTNSLEIEELTKLRTLRGIVLRMLEALAAGEKTGAASIPVPNETPATQDPVSASQVDLARFVIVPDDAPSSDLSVRKFPQSVVLVTDDERGIARAVIELLGENNVPAALVRMGSHAEEAGDVYTAELTNPQSAADVVERIRQKRGPIAGIIHLLPFRGETDFDAAEVSECREQFRQDVKSLFYLAKAACPDMKSQAVTATSWLCAPIALDAMIPTGKSSTFPSHGAIRGLVKTFAAECPKLYCKIVAFDRTHSPEGIAGLIVAEMQSWNQDVEVGFEGNRRVAMRPKREANALTENGTTIDSTSVILVTGGARGITAEAAQGLAKYKPTLLLVGRSPFPMTEESQVTAGCTSPAELKKRLIEQMRRDSSAAKPSEVEAAYQALLHEREIRERIGSLRRAGATVSYLQSDVRDENAVRRMVEEIYRTYGRLDGAIHGAGIIEDKLVEDKTPESFDRVFDTKIDSTIILSRVLRPDSLKFFVLFSSVSGAFGNRGQVDYAAANAGLDGIAAYLDQRWPGHVVSIDWGPWDKVGMVSDLVRAQLVQRGVQLISGIAGVRALEQEILRGKKGEVQVVLGGGPWEVSSPVPSKQMAGLPTTPLPVSPVMVSAA